MGGGIYRLISTTWVFTVGTYWYEIPYLEPAIRELLHQRNGVLTL